MYPHPHDTPLNPSATPKALAEYTNTNPNPTLKPQP